MNSLEFIENIIENLKQIIEDINQQIQSNENYPTLLKCNISDKQHYEQEINYFQQIKTKLEAWQVVEKHLEYFPSDFYNGIPEEIITMTSSIDKKDYPTIKKALEVK